MNKKTDSILYLSCFYSPALAFNQLQRRSDSMRLGYFYMLIPSIAYTSMYIFLTIAEGAPSVFTPWLNIPKENYYAYNRFLLAPSLFLGWLSSSAIIQVLAFANQGKGSFEQTLPAVGLAISVAMWGGLIHDLPMSILSALGVIDARQHEIDMNSPTLFRTLLWICYSIYLIYFLILFTLAIRVVHQMGWIKSIWIGVVGFVLFQTIFFIFYR
ncbi:MAG: YIP1 family protein [Saprospiraceae bacterium]|nr:YIP1 family protein [Saprospiraceae bacterium]